MLIKLITSGQLNQDHISLFLSQVVLTLFSFELLKKEFLKLFENQAGTELEKLDKTSLAKIPRPL